MNLFVSTMYFLLKKIFFKVAIRLYIWLALRLELVKFINMCLMKQILDGDTTVLQIDCTHRKYKGQKGNIVVSREFYAIREMK